MPTKAIPQILCAASALTVALSVAPAFAGGFAVWPERPAETVLARVPDAVLSLSPEGCIEADSGSVQVTAVGVVNGQRRTVIVPAIKVRPHLFAIRHTWPTEGNWVLVIRGSAHRANGVTFQRHQLLAWKEQGMVEESMRYGGGVRRFFRPTFVDSGKLAQEIDAMLGRGGGTTASVR